MLRIGGKCSGILQTRKGLLSFPPRMTGLRFFSNTNANSDRNADDAKKKTTSSALPLQGDMRPLIKKIHPDFFATQAPEIQNANLKCLQTLQELQQQILYTLELVGKEQKILDSNPLRANPANVNIGFPKAFQAVYRLSCYVYKPVPSKDDTDTSEGEKEEAEVELAHISVNIITPPALKRNQINDLSSFQSSLRQFLTSHSLLWEKAGLPYPYEQSLLRGGSPGQAFGEDNSKDGNTGVDFFKDFNVDKNELLYDMFAAALRKKMYTQGNVNPILSAASKGNTKEFTKYSRSLEYKKLVQQRKQEIDHFLKTNHVRLLNVGIAEELTVVSRFRDFLIDYGDALNFTFVDWRHVYFVLYQTSGKSKPVEPFQIKQVLKSSRKHLIDENKPIQEEDVQAVIVKVPVDFKVKSLIDYLHDNLTCTQLRF